MADLPPWHPPRAVLELAELVADGVLAAMPDLTSAAVRTALAVAVPDDVLAALAGAGVTLQDAEGTPVAVLRPGTGGPGSRVDALRPFAHGPLRSHRRRPAEVAEPDAGVGPGAVAVLVDAAPSVAGVEAVLADAGPSPLLWLLRCGVGTWPGLTPEAARRALSVVAAEAGGTVLPLAVPAGAERLLPDLPAMLAAAFAAARVIPLGPAGTHPPHPAFAAELDRAAVPVSRRGVVVLLTGLSGSGKSTIARGLADRLLDDGRRTLTMLDGDEVRRLLSHGLGFSRADRDLNIRRIGFVAAEVARHGGLALCAPIAPFDAVRQEVRAMVTEAGGDLLLVHVATPLAECERRDRKGLYAAARRGEVTEFTGISSPYEPPADADLVLDTTGTPVEDAVSAVWGLLAARGYLGSVDCEKV